MSLRAGHTPKKTMKKRRFKLRLFLWLIIGLVFLSGIILLGIWTQRHSLAEDQIKAMLAERGIESELSVSKLGKDLAIVKNIELSENGKPFFSAGEIIVTYDWQKARSGDFETVSISDLEIDIELDDKARPILAFLQKNGGSNGQSLPSQGVSIENGTTRIVSPYGTITAGISGNFQSEDNFDVALNLISSTIKYGDVSFTASGPVAASRQDSDPEFDLTLNIPIWSYKELSGENLVLTGKGAAAINDIGIAIDGRFSAGFESFQGKAVQSAEGLFGWAGQMTVPRQNDGTLQADGDWDAIIHDIAMPNDAKRDAMARRLSLYESLSKSPVMSNFAQPLSSALDDLLVGGDVRGMGRLEKDETRSQIYVTGPLSWQNSDHTIAASAIGELPFYDYQRHSSEIELKFEADLQSHYPFKIKRGELKIGSTNGRNIKGINSFDSNIQIASSWFAKTPDGQKVHLRPMDAKLSYIGDDQKRRLSLTGDIRYDGDIPGGYVSDLYASGTLALAIKDQTDIYFTPHPGSRVSMTRFQTAAPWIAYDLSFSLNSGSGQPLYTRLSKGGKMLADLSDLKARLVSEDELRSLQLSYEKAEVRADIAQSRQEWAVDGQGIVATSDTMPGPGTIMAAPKADLVAVLVARALPEFTLIAPSADVKTSAIDAKNLIVDVSGSSEKFRVNYQDGQVDFTATEFPPFTMAGYVDYDQNIWTGRADSVLPFDRVTPLDIAYSFENGRGVADVDIKEISFAPRGLQPQLLIPALRGKVADVDGQASAKIHLEFAQGEDMTSSGSAQLIDMDFGTLPGPLTGVNAELGFSSFFPLVSDGPQVATLESFDPGFPLYGGEVTFEAVPNGVKIHKARWPVGSGQVSLKPARWTYLAPENRMSLQVENVELGEFLGGVGGEKFSATGTVNGSLPVVISGVSVTVENGRLAVKDGGVIRYQSDQTDSVSETNEIAGYAFEALKEFHYQELEAIMNGPLDGTIILKLLFEGSNADVLSGARFRFNVDMEGELLNIARGFNLGSRIADEVKNAVLAHSRDEDLFKPD